VLAGQVGFDAGSGGLAAGGTAAEARQAFANVTAVLTDCAASWADVAKVTIFLTDMADFGAVNDVYAEAVGEHRPARTTVQVAALPIGAGIEIEVLAHSPA
jgi:2-iminobutanoate/2-iminopropanoate deaminase